MIQQFPTDFTPTTYDLKTSDGSIWKIVQTGDIYQLQSGDKAFDLMALDGRFTFFTNDYHNINLHGFYIAGVHYEITEAVPNENWVEPPPVPEAPDEPGLVKHYSQYALMCALEDAGLWATVKNAIIEAGRWDAFTLAQDLASDNPDFISMKAVLSQLLPVDADEILAGCELDKP